MEIAVICGSQRPDSESARVGRFLERRLLDRGLCDTAWRLELGETPLPLWRPGIHQDPEHATRLAELGQRLAATDGFVVITPEWCGMVPGALKNFFLLWGPGELANKPALPVAVSSEDGGAYPIAELRMSSYKNSRLLYVPENLIVRWVVERLHETLSTAQPEADALLRERADYALTQLCAYAAALAPQRASGNIAVGDYESGM